MPAPELALMHWTRRFVAILSLDGLLDGRLATPTGVVARFAIAAAMVGVGVLLRLWLDPWITGARFIALFPAVLAATLLCGPAPGLFAVALSAVAARRIFGADQSSLADANSIGLFVVVAVLNVAVISALLMAYDAARRALASVAELNAKLTLSESRFREVVESAPDAMVIVDRGGRIVLVNAETERLFGYGRGDLVGQPLNELMPMRFRPGHEACVRDFAPGNSVKRMGSELDLFGLTRDGREFPIETNLSVLPDAGGALVSGVIRDLTARMESDERQNLLMRELNHRVKNTLASVQSIVRHTLKATVTPAEFGVSVTARLAALSQSHDVLTRNDWAGASIHEIVAEQLSPYEREVGLAFALVGDKVQLTPNRAVALGMAIGELATNAAKFGALSGSGSVEVSWRRRRLVNEERVRITWVERGGPRVKAPTREGFGTRMIKRSLLTGLHGSANFDFAEEGVTCVLDFPLLPEER